ncbi:hypothetical protein ABEY24_17730 [Peribacillus frigoritolerans]|uniref:hypothetical protein n=1 Tax=Peribacillus frigoritolerans TaxID=450367 RepID=UPI003D2C70F4
MRLRGLPWTRFSRRSLVPSVPINFVLLKKLQAGLFRTSFRLVYPLSFSPVLLNGWKKYATLQPKNWLAETPQTLASMRLGNQSAERERISEIKWNFYKKELQVRLIQNPI